MGSPALATWQIEYNIMFREPENYLFSPPFPQILIKYQESNQTPCFFYQSAYNKINKVNF